MVMTSKTNISLTLVVIAAAIILPVSTINIDAAPDTGNNAAVAETERINKIAEPYFTAKDQLNRAEFELKTLQANGTLEQVSDKQAQIDQLKDELVGLKKTVAEAERETIERYKIDPTMEKKLRTAQSSIDHKDLPVSSTSVSGLEKVLIINLDESRFEEGKDRAYYAALFEERFSDIPVKIRFNVAVAESCQGPGSNCDPLVGGIKIEAKNHSWCSMALPIERNGADGFLTAAHCVDDGSGSADDVFQPTEDWLGWNKVGDVSIIADNADCDCAWVDQSSSESNEEAVWDGYNSWETITSYNDRPTSGTYVLVHGAKSSLGWTTVDDPNSSWYNSDTGITYDAVLTVAHVTDGGDSGGAWTNWDSDEFMGIHAAGDSVGSYFTPWENVNDSTTGVGPLG